MIKIFYHREHEDTEIKMSSKNYIISPCLCVLQRSGWLNNAFSQMWFNSFWCWLCQVGF